MEGSGTAPPIIFNRYDITIWNNRDSVLKTKLQYHYFESVRNKKLAKLMHTTFYLRYKIESKLMHRFFIWSVSSKKALDKKILGYGISSSRKFGALDTVEFKEIVNGKEVIINYPAIPLHTHNNTLQIWLEMGLIGIILFYSFLSIFWYRILFKYNFNKNQYAAISGSFFSIFLINQSSYGLWQTWWVSSVLLCIVFFKLILKDYDDFKDITKIPKTINDAPNQ